MKSIILFAIICLSTGWARGTQITQERQASVTEDTKTVIATGMGIDRDAALKQALRSAVEQAIGVFLKTETVVENFQLINDKILTHSRGYVQSFDIVNEGPADGLYNLSLSAVVTIKELEVTLVEMKLYSREVAGESLFGTAFSQIEERKSGAALYEDLNQTLVSKAIAVEFEEVEVESVEGDSATIIIPFHLVWDEAFLIDLTDILEQTSEAVAHTQDERIKLNEQYKPQWDRGITEIRVTDNHPSPTQITFYFVKDIYAKSLVENLLCHFRYDGNVLLYEIQLLLKDTNGRDVLEESIRRKTSLLGFSKKQTNSGFRISNITLVKHVRSDWQRKRDHTYLTATMHVDQLKEIRSVTGSLKF